MSTDVGGCQERPSVCSLAGLREHSCGFNGGRRHVFHVPCDISGIYLGPEKYASPTPWVVLCGPNGLWYRTPKVTLAVAWSPPPSFVWFHPHTLDRVAGAKNCINQKWWIADEIIFSTKPLTYNRMCYLNKEITLIASQTGIALLYILLKIHKDPIHPPGCPIVSGWAQYLYLKPCFWINYLLCLFKIIGH